MKKEKQTGLLHHHRPGKGQCHTDKTNLTLSEPLDRDTVRSHSLWSARFHILSTEPAVQVGLCWLPEPSVLAETIQIKKTVTHAEDDLAGCV
jgi:hypothetical protein